MGFLIWFSWDFMQWFVFEECVVILRTGKNAPWLNGSIQPLMSLISTGAGIWLYISYTVLSTSQGIPDDSRDSLLKYCSFAEHYLRILEI